MTERCDFCIPENKLIYDNVGEFMSLAELVSVRGGIEVLGKVLHCGDEKEICLPLLRVQRLITKYDKREL